MIDEAFRVHDPVNDTRRVVIMLGQRQQVRLLLGVRVQRPLLGAAMRPYVGDVRQPPTRDFVEVLQAPEAAAIQ